MGPVGVMRGCATRKLLDLMANCPEEPSQIVVRSGTQIKPMKPSEP
jgi:hypothetical protein